MRGWRHEFDSPADVEDRGALRRGPFGHTVEAGFLDGTKVKANASKYKAMSYERMLKAEAELREEIEQLLLLAEQTDQEEDARYGRGKRGDEVPEELRRRESRLATIQATMAELEAEAARSTPGERSYRSRSSARSGLARDSNTSSSMGSKTRSGGRSEIYRAPAG